MFNVRIFREGSTEGYDLRPTKTKEAALALASGWRPFGIVRYDIHEITSYQGKQRNLGSLVKHWSKPDGRTATTN